MKTLNFLLNNKFKFGFVFVNCLNILFMKYKDEILRVLINFVFKRRVALIKRRAISRKADQIYRIYQSDYIFFVTKLYISILKSQ